MRLVTRWLITAAAVAITAWLLPGIDVIGTQTQRVLAVLVFAIVLGLLNAVVRPVLALLSCGLIIATLGIFMLFINGMMFWLASAMTEWLGFGIVINDYWTAFWAAIIVSVVSFFITVLLPDSVTNAE
jgi:putative membrane protein